MRSVKLTERFFANVERDMAEQQCRALEMSLERIVAGWLADTGLWPLGLSITISRTPYGLGDLEVRANADASRYPFLVAEGVRHGGEPGV